MDVPVLVETLGRSYFPMVRCLYLAVEFDTPSRQWSLGLGGRSFPFLMLGLTGVVQTPLDTSQFYSPNVIDDFLDTVENADGMVLFEDIWFPKVLFLDSVLEGDVYRVGVDLFRQAFRYREGSSTEETFRFVTQESHAHMTFSQEETMAFRSWSVRTIDIVRREGPKDARLRLERKRER